MEMEGDQDTQSTCDVLDHGRDFSNATASMKCYQDFRVLMLELFAGKVRVFH